MFYPARGGFRPTCSAHQGIPHAPMKQEFHSRKDQRILQQFDFQNRAIFKDIFACTAVKPTFRFLTNTCVVVKQMPFSSTILNLPTYVILLCKSSVLVASLSLLSDGIPNLIVRRGFPGGPSGWDEIPIEREKLWKNICRCNLHNIHAVTLDNPLTAKCFIYDVVRSFFI